MVKSQEVSSKPWPESASRRSDFDERRWHRHRFMCPEPTRPRRAGLGRRTSVSTAPLDAVERKLRAPSRPGKARLGRLGPRFRVCRIEWRRRQLFSSKSEVCAADSS